MTEPTSLREAIAARDAAQRQARDDAEQARLAAFQPDPAMEADAAAVDALITAHPGRRGDSTVMQRRAVALAYLNTAAAAGHPVDEAVRARLTSA